jgi:hypothetical protein
MARQRLLRCPGSAITDPADRADRTDHTDPADLVERAGAK